MAVPVSLIGTFIIFPLLGFSINTLSLFGLVLAIGLVVDDAIIVVEAVEHLHRRGHDAARCGRPRDGRGGRAGGGDRADSGGGLHSDGRYPRHHGPALSAVRDHHRDLGADLGVQCADAQPGAGGAAAEAARARSGGAVRCSASSIGSTGSSAAPPRSMSRPPAC